MKQLFYTMLIIILALSSTLVAQKKYNALSAGYGASYGGYGIMYQSRSDMGGFHIGIGYLPSQYEYADGVTLFNLGYKFFMKNDWFFDLQFGGVGMEATNETYYDYFSLENSSEVQQQTLYGISMLFGKSIWFSGEKVGLNLAIGGSYSVTKVEWVDLGIFPTADIGIMFKL